MRLHVLYVFFVQSNIVKADCQTIYQALISIYLAQTIPQHRPGLPPLLLVDIALVREKRHQHISIFQTNGYLVQIINVCIL